MSRPRWPQIVAGAHAFSLEPPRSICSTGGRKLSQAPFPYVIKETYGVPVEEIVEGIKYGVRKVNIDTDLRLASTGAMRRLMAQNPSEFDPRKFFGESVKAMRDVCIARYEAFGTAGNASKIKPISLEGMYQRYLKGELAAKVN